MAKHNHGGAKVPTPKAPGAGSVHKVSTGGNLTKGKAQSSQQPVKQHPSTKDLGSHSRDNC